MKNILAILDKYICNSIPWLTLCMVLLMVVLVFLRYALDIGSVALQESVIYLHAFMIAFGAGIGIKDDTHVRVDLFYRDFSETQKALVNLSGTIVFLFPLALFIGLYCFEYVVQAWEIKERSLEAGGLPFNYILKTTLLILPSYLLLQSIRIVSSCIQALLHHK